MKILASSIANAFSPTRPNEFSPDSRKASLKTTPTRLTVNNPVRLDPNADPETSRSQIDRAQSRLHQSEPCRAGFPAGNRPYAERLPAAALKKGNVRKSCEFTARAAPKSFTQRPDFSGVFASDTSAGKLRTEKDLTIAPK
jgi:hypothetical protein